MQQDLDRFLPAGGALTGRLFSRLIGESSSDPVLPNGTLVGYWRVVRLLGRGGSSIVYLADRADGQFEQEAALKIVNTSHSLDHFRRERQILAELHHPAIAQIIDGGQLPGGRLWFAMEPVFGQRIDRYVRERRLALNERLDVFDKVCEAIAYAHSRLLIHRDIKPGNLLVDELGHPRLLDFGIATTSDLADEAAAMTLTYASPEQRRGGAITTASDIYQLGLLLGSLVLPAGAPCETLPRSLRPIVRRELAAIIAHATALDPADRYPTVAAFRADVAAIRRRYPVSVIGGLAYPLRCFFERNRVSSAIAATGAATLLATALVFTHRVQTERDQARAAAARSKATSNFLVGLFSVSDPAVNRGEKLTASQILARGAQQIPRTFDEDPEQAVAVALEIGRVYMLLGDFERAGNLLDAALAALEETLPDAALQRVQLRTLRGRAFYFLADYAGAERDFAQARQDLALVWDPFERDEAEGELASNEAYLLRRQGKTKEALERQFHAIDLLQHCEPPDAYRLGLAWNNVGLIQRDLGDFAAAERAYAESADVLEQAFGPDDPRLLMPKENLAEALVRSDQIERAEPLLLENIERRRAVQEGPSSGLMASLDLLSQLRLDQNRNEEAAEAALEADNGYKAMLGPTHNYRSFPLIHLGHARLRVGNGPGALDAFQEALRLRREAFGDQHPDVANAWHNLGQAYSTLGDFTSAESAFHEAVAIREQVLAPGHVVLPRTRIDHAESLVSLGRREDAASELGRAKEELTSVAGDTREDLRRIEAVEARLGSD